MIEIIKKIISDGDLLPISRAAASISHPWELIPLIKGLIGELIDFLKNREDYTLLDNDILVNNSARVAPSALIEGPAVIMDGAEIRHCAYLRGSVLVGRQCTVGNSSEVKNALLLDGAALPHFNYVGDSVLGPKAHLGAGAIVSNLRSDGASVKLTLDGERIDSGLRKLGAVIGASAEIGAGAILNPGTVIGSGARVYPLSSVRGTVESRSIHKQDGSIVRILD